jgi:hypothetical protein
MRGDNLDFYTIGIITRTRAGFAAKVHKICDLPAFQMLFFAFIG